MRRKKSVREDPKGAEALLGRYRVRRPGRDRILVSDIDMAWDIKKGTVTFQGLPVIMLWVGSTLAGLMAGVEAMVGDRRFFLAQQSQGRLSCEDDWGIISRYKDFREGFKAIANIAAVAGWGAWRLKALDKGKKRAVVEIRDSWEGNYQKGLGVCWGSGMLAGKMSGYCSLLFHTNCWAEQTKFIARGDACDAFVVAPSGRSVEREIEKLLTSDEATRADMAVALKKLQEEIRERKKSEEKLKSYQKHLAAMNEELRKAVRAKSDFTEMVSHELRTPLAAIKESINLVLEKVTGAITAEQEAILNITRNNVDRLARLINDVLNFQKLESGKMQFRMLMNDINKVAREVGEAMTPSIRKKGLDLAMRLGRPIPPARFDHDRIAEVLTNLIDNATKFTEKGSIVITTAVAKECIQVTVADTGHGIKRGDMDKLFERFMQLQRKPGGTGLGLAICKDIVERHAGRIWAESTFARGTSFHFTLPLVRKRR